jgi:transposase
MSKSILTEVFGVAEGYELVRTEYEGDFLRLHLDVVESRFVCPRCASHQVSRKGRRHRELQTVPIGLTPVYLHAEVPDCHCRDCGARFELSPPLPPPIAGSPIDWWTSSRPSPS